MIRDSSGSLTVHPYFGRYVEHVPERFPRALSYQEYINTLDPERGMILELIWRSPHFEQMRCWDYSNSRIMEVRYEDLIENEADTFGRLLENYGFAPPVVARGVALRPTLIAWQDNLHRCCRVWGRLSHGCRRFGRRTRRAARAAS